MKKILLWVSAALLAALAVFAVPTIWFKPWSIDHYYMRVFLRFAMRHPTFMTQLGMLDGTPFDHYSDKLDDLSPEFERMESGKVKEELAMLRRYDRSRMSAGERLSADVLGWFLENQSKSDRFLFYDYPVNQMFGVQSALPDFMMTVHPLKHPPDAENYIRRLSHFGAAFDQTLAGLELRRSKGIVPPRFVLDRVLKEMRDFTAKPAALNPLVTTFATRIDSIRGLDSEKREALVARAEREVAGTVYPAYARLIAGCEKLEASATTEDGVWKLPDGDAFYQNCLRGHTTTDLPADSIHALGLREVDRIQGQMRALLRERGYKVDDVAAAMQKLVKEPRFHYPAGDEGRAKILADYQSIIDDADHRMSALFDVRPKTGVKVERVPAFKEATAPGGYYNPGSMNGARPGVFYANLRDPAETQRPGMRTLAYHEAIPGHHFQLTVAQEMKGLPFFRRVLPFTAYSEGWGLYAEHLALENGFHQDAFDSLGALQADLFRAVRLVVDTGIHRSRWTRQQAIDYMVRNTGLDTTKVVTEIERYIVLPGQACAYKVGELEILQLRQKAMDALGGHFDIRKFHDVVLTNGALPLSILERVVDEWIAAEKRAESQAGRG
ncbi:MAG TPA: DUF885 domain-containing protein [Candidatus Eisenbacteria bacterium]|jgi:uncharacterized protein (DUF885 family)